MENRASKVGPLVTGAMDFLRLAVGPMEDYADLFESSKIMHSETCHAPLFVPQLPESFRRVGSVPLI
jgi:hypothetical protein